MLKCPWIGHNRHIPGMLARGDYSVQVTSTFSPYIDIELTPKLVKHLYNCIREVI